MEAYGRIRLLSPDVARKIAAGEVVDRPAALVRELVDNAIDSGASMVEVAIEGGGSRRVEVSDDGCGMDRENLELCTLPHATSKIRSAEDLESAETLGFRGEALAAAAAVARVEITSSPNGREAWRLAAGPGTEGSATPELRSARRAKGTGVRVLGLFDAIPARKKFLKRDGAEGSLCRQALVDKALAFPELTFRFIKDGKLDIFLPAVPTLKERFAAALLDRSQGAFLHELSVSGPGFSASIVIGGPDLHRSDRRLLFAFANGRRIQDFGLIQALEFGAQLWFPNGTHPVGAIYVDIDPALADFNIHPAKREVRFKDGGAIHHAVSSGLRDYLKRLGLRESERTGSPYRSPADRSAFDRSAEGQLAMEAFLERPPTFAPLPSRRSEGAHDAKAPSPLSGDGRTNAHSLPVALQAAAESFEARSRGDDGVREAALPGVVRYVGHAFELFILVEKGDRLYLIDQHAAHERLIYDRFRSGPVERQELLVPLPFTTDGDDEDAFLEARREELDRLGIRVERDGDSAWRMETLPAGWRTADGETVRALLELRHAGESLAERWTATMACRAAVKDGDYLDPDAALALAKAALELEQPRCPHGRPIWTELRREDILKAVRRIE